MSLKATLKHNTPYSKLMISVGVILLCAILFTFIASVFIMGNMGLSMMQMQNLMKDLSNPLALSALKIIQTIASIGTFIVPAFILAWLFHENPKVYLMLHKKPQFKLVALAVLLLITVIPAINFIAELNTHLKLPAFMSGVEKWMKDSEESAGKMTALFLDMKTPVDLMYMLVVVALIPAVGEELLFRGIVQRIFLSWTKNVHLGIWLAAIVFSAVHVQFYGFVPRMLLGALLGYMCVWSGSLWLSIIAHFINNASAIILMYLFTHNKLKINPDEIGNDNSNFLPLIISVVLSAGLLWLLYSNKEKDSVTTEQV